MSLVSANFLNRSSENRWLVVDTQPYVEKKFLYLKNVSFRQAPEAIVGFGCSVVAECGEVHDHSMRDLVAKGFKRVRYNGGGGFYYRSTPHTTHTVFGVEEMYLGRDGKIWGRGIQTDTCVFAPVPAEVTPTVTEEVQA